MNRNKEYMDGLSLRSEEVQEIMSKPPHCMIRWGLIVVGLMLVGLFLGSAFVRYEETIPAQVVLERNNLSTSIYAKETGVIKRLYIKNGDYVSEGDSLIEYSKMTALTRDSLNIILSTVNGWVSFPYNRHAGTIFKKGDQLFVIKEQGAKPAKLLCYGFIAQKYRYLVKSGQSIKIKLVTRKSKKSVIAGSIKEISQLPNEKHLYYFEITLKECDVFKYLLSNYENMMTLNGEITIDSQRFITNFLPKFL